MANSSLIYLLDSSVLMLANRHYYGMDFCPAFWDCIKKHNNIIYSIDEVKDEIDKGGDQLVAWAKNQPSTFFRKTDEDIINRYLTYY